MANKIFNLSGDWSLCWFDIEKGSLEKATHAFNSCDAILSRVPGDVHDDLARAGIISEPLLDLNSQDCRWMEQKEFWYKKSFTIDSSFLQDLTTLTLEGLDLSADIWLNGKYIGNHNNAFIEKIIDVSDSIRAGENTLIVRIDDGVNGVKDKPIDFTKFSWNNEQPFRAWMRKPQFVYGWDWTIWLPTCGIWKDVYLTSYKSVKPNDVYIKTVYGGELISEAKSISLDILCDLDVLKEGNYTVKVEAFEDDRYDRADKPVSAGYAKVCVSSSVTVNLELKSPKLWWPNGAGKPYLYLIKVTVLDENGNAVYSCEKHHGLRSVRICEPQIDDHSKSFTYVINDRPIFAKGANHVPADCLLGRITDEKNRALLEAACDAHMNMIRVWGGGIYESDSFMDTCDELGLMVWHDFMFACAYYPDHIPEFYEEIRREAAAAIKRLRSHASLIGWSGNNEIQEMYTSAINSGRNIPWYGGRLYEELLPSLVKDLCPDRIYRESSPFGGDEPTSYDEGDQHTWHFTHRPAWEHYLDLWHFTDFDFKFLSEFGIIGAMNLESAKKCISLDKLDPRSKEWLFHTNSSGDHKLIDIFVKQYFNIDDNISLQDYILRSQVAQAEIMRHVYDELRSRKFRCSGILLWTLSDSYGINNWSVIDYYLGKRPIYYYLKRTMAPINLSFRGYAAQSFEGMAGYTEYYKNNPKPIEIHLASDLFEDKPLTVEYKVMTFDGKVLKGGALNYTAPANSAEKVCEIEICDIPNLVPEETILYVKALDSGVVINENRYFLAPYKTLKLKPASVKCKTEKVSDNETRLTLYADTFVWMLHLPDADGITFSDNDFDLIPNQEKVITLYGNTSGYSPNLLSINPLINIEI